jgi:hypothetical protein
MFVRVPDTFATFRRVMPGRARPLAHLHDPPGADTLPRSEAPVGASRIVQAETRA